MRMVAFALLLRLAAGTALAESRLQGGCATGVSADPSGRYAAVSHPGGVVELVDLLARRSVRSVRLPMGQSMRAPRFSADGRRVTGFDRQLLHTWDLDTGRVSTLDVSPDVHGDHLMAATPDQRWALTSGATGLGPIWMDLLDGRTGASTKRVTSGLRSTTLKLTVHPIENLFDATINHCEPYSTYHPVMVQSAAFSDDGTLLATCIEGRVRLWNVPRLKRIASVAGPRDGGAVVFSPDASILAAAVDRELLILDGRTGHRIARQTLEWSAMALALRPDGREVAMLCNNTLDIHAAPGWTRVRSTPLDVIPWSVAYATAPSRILIACGSHGLEICDPKTGKLIDRLPGRASN